MVSFPNAKINLGLYVTAKRADGFHDIETIFYPIRSLRDALELIPGEQDIQFTSSGLSIQGSLEDNLCVKAYHLLKTRYPQLPPVQIHLLKAIPMGAGLGGGSADGAFMLQLLNNRFSLGASVEELAMLALQLGSDCPFFLWNTACHATGRGEMITPVELELSNYRIVLINPGIHIPTGWAFSQIRPGKPEHPILNILSLTVDQWKHTLSNDFEAPVMDAYPAIRAIKEQLYAAGALYASMTGTGSTVYGIFPKDIEPALSFPEHYLIH